jgi:hypothetical protein
MGHMGLVCMHRYRFLTIAQFSDRDLTEAQTLVRELQEFRVEFTAAGAAPCSELAPLCVPVIDEDPRA